MITEHLGSGQFGTVNKGVWQSPAGAVEVAVKTLQSSASQKDRVKFLQEAAINGQFRHPNVCLFYHCISNTEKPLFCLCMCMCILLIHFTSMEGSVVAHIGTVQFHCLQ